MKPVLLAVWLVLSIGLAASSQHLQQEERFPWAAHAEVSGFIYPDDFYMNPVAWGRISRIHLEARYNYEDFETVSVFAGYNFEVGHELFLTATPLFGFAAGNTDAIIPGVEFELMYGKFGWYGEAEYVFDLEDGADNFFSHWSELYYSPAPWTWFGITTQRIRFYQTDLYLQRGLMLAFQFDPFIITGYYFNPFTEEHFGILNLGITLVNR